MSSSWYHAITKETLLPLIKSLVASELSRSRNSDQLKLQVVNWQKDTSLDKHGLALDSIELMAVAGSVNQLFHLHHHGIEDYLLRYRTLGEWCEIVAKGWEEGQTHLTFQTSGSTGTPKAVTHQITTLVQEIEALACLFPCCERILACVPNHHIYGFLFTVLLPWHIQCPVLQVQHWQGSAFAEQLRSGDLIVSFPHHWEFLQRSLHQLPAEIHGVTSTSPCPPNLIFSLQQQGLQRMTEVYGSTETAGVGYRHAPVDPYILFNYWQFAENGSVANGKTIHENKTQLQRILPDGTLQAPIALMDTLEWKDSRHFIPHKRKDQMVQVAGVNVSPQQVADRLQAHPWVSECAVRLMRPEEGNRLKAFLVLDSTIMITEETEEQLNLWCKETFSTAERPTRLTLAYALPTNDLGKLKDW